MTGGCDVGDVVVFARHQGQKSAITSVQAPPTLEEKRDLFLCLVVFGVWFNGGYLFRRFPLFVYFCLVSVGSGFSLTFHPELYHLVTLRDKEPERERYVDVHLDEGEEKNEREEEREPRVKRKVRSKQPQLLFPLANCWEQVTSLRKILDFPFLCP